MKKVYYLVPLLFLLLNHISCNEDEGIIEEFYMYPNPINVSSHNIAKFKIVFSKPISGDIDITVYNRAKAGVWDSSKDITTVTNEETIEWGGVNYSGEKLVPGIYYAKASLKGTYSSEMTIEIIIN